MQQPILQFGNTGYLYKERKKEDYIAGKIKKGIIFSDGHGWGNHRPVGEKQYNAFGIDPWSCVLESDTSAIEYEMNRRLQTGEIKEGGEEFEFNDGLGLIYKINGKWQFNASGIVLALMSGATGSGTSLNNGAETMRKKGLVGEDVYTKWKDARTVAKMLNQDNLTADLISRGKKWLTKYEIQHEWVFDSRNFPSTAQKRDLLKEYFRYGVIQLTGRSWVKINSKGQYCYTAGSANHAFIGEDYEEVNQAYEQTIAFDTYIKNQKFTKYLAPDYLFWQAKQFTIISNFPKVTKPAEIKEENMIFYKDKRRSTVYQKGADGRYYPIFNADIFKKLYGEFEDNKIEDITIFESETGDTIYFKSTLINLIFSFFATLGKKLGIIK